MTIKDAFQFGIEPVRITDTDNIQVNEGLPTNADQQVYALQLAKTVKAMLNGVLKDAQENIPFTALSFGCFRHDGENITVVLSRDGDSQSHDLEILGKVFVVAEAATTIKMGTGSATAVLPVVKRLKFTKTEA